MYLVTPESLDSCAADKVQISIILDTLNIGELPTVYESIPSIFPLCPNRVIITCPSLCNKYSHELWSKDGQQLESSDRLKFSRDEDRCQVEILKTVTTDKGRYKCEYMGQGKRKHS